MRRQRLGLTLIPIMAIALLAGWSCPASAGELSAGLAATLRGLEPDAPVAVLVELAGRGPVPGIDGETRAERRARLVDGLRGRAGVAEPAVIALLDEIGATGVVSLWAIGGLAATVPAGAVAVLAGHPGVRGVRLDGALSLPAAPKAAAQAPGWNLDMIGAPELWARGITGEGVVVAILDSGVDERHVDLASRWRGGAADWFDPYGQYAGPHDSDGHGTQVAGLIVGGDATGTAIGVAPGAQWIAGRVFDDGGHATYSAIHQVFQWSLDPDGTPATDDAPDVVNASWGFSDQAGQCIDEFASDIAVLRSAGIAVVFSAGNSGPGSGTSLSPADNPGAFAVGGVDATAAVMQASSRGPSACDGGIFPALVAPGDGVVTTDKTFGGVFPTATATVSGTSFAAPQVAGALGLLLEAHPEASPAQLEASLRAGAADLGPSGPDNDAGWGLLDVVTAETALTGLLAGPGTVTTYVDEAAFLAAVAGAGTVFEGFEDDAAWGAARSPATQPSVLSQEITWASNHPPNEVTTSYGAAHSGGWGVLSSPHGDQTVTDPNGFITDGFAAVSATTLVAVGGWFKGLPGSRLALVLDGDQANRITLGPVGNVHSFYGAVVSGSFVTFEFLETEGTRQDAKYIFGDDMTIALAGGVANRPPEGTIVQPAGDVTVDQGSAVFFEGAASDPDGDPVTVLWDFGDGRTSAELSPGSVVYPVAGTYTVILTASDDRGLSDPTPPSRTVTVRQPALAMAGVVAGVANLPGAQGSDWHTDLFLHNAAGALASVELYYSPAGATVGAPSVISVGPDETVALEDVVAFLFGASGSGAIQWRVVGGDPGSVFVTANTYNRVDSVRRYGQQVAGVRWSDVSSEGTSVWLPALAGRYRTNLGFATDGDCTEVRVRGYDRSGALVAQRNLAVQPWSWTQLNSLFRRVFPDLIQDPDAVPVAESLHRFEVVGVGGRAVAYTSIIDNSTSDGSYMLGQVAGGTDAQWLPGAAVINGANASRWRSDVVVMNAAGGAAAATFDFLPSGRDNGGALDQRTVPIAVGESVFEGNILAELFGYAPPVVGSLAISAPASAPVLWMRTYTEEPADGGGTVTYGQAVLPRTAAATVGPGADGRIAGFSHDAVTRSNLILQNTRTASDGARLGCNVRVELLAADGALLHTQDYALLPGEYRQHNRFIDDYGTGPVEHASLRVTVIDEPGAGETGGVDAMVSEINGNVVPGTNDSRLIRAEIAP